jgi:hypothetical protein
LPRSSRFPRRKAKNYKNKFYNYNNNKQLPMNNNKNDEVKALINRLKQLQLEQSVIIASLELLSEVEGDVKGIEEGNVARQFVVGDEVRITNPRRLQAAKGTITKIGKRITVEARNGSTIVRLAKNLTLA